MSELLEKARSYEAKKIAATDKESKPLFHISAPAGWINDPNGFSVYNGKIHLFYQYYPYLREWGPMHWGHSTTSDMIKWEQLPCVMAPDEEYDKKDVSQEVPLRQMVSMCLYTQVSQVLNFLTAVSRRDRTSASHLETDLIM